MPELGRYARQLRTLLWKPSVDNEVKDELNAHIEQLEQDLIAKGIDPAAARAEATRKFGNVERLAAECRTLGEERDVARRRASRWQDLTSDVRYALRQLIASPRFALIAIATLSIGLGASTTIFSIANAVLLRPLPYADPGQLVLAFELNTEGDRFSISEPNFLDMQSRVKSLQSVATVTQRRREIGVTLALGAQPGSVVRKIVGDGLRITLAGVAVGTAVSVLISGALRAILYETDPTSAITFVSVSVLLLIVGLVASALPARKASQLNPVIAMRGD